MILNSILNFLFSPLTLLPPAFSIFILATLVSGIMIFINKKTIWSEEGKKIQEKMKGDKKLKEQLDAAQKKGDKKKIEQLNKKSLEEQSKYMMEYMKFSLKPILISLLIAIIILPWLSETYKNTTVVIIPKFIPLIGGLELTWIWWYIICALAISLLGKKIFEGKK